LMKSTCSITISAFRRDFLSFSTCVFDSAVSSTVSAASFTAAGIDGSASTCSYYEQSAQSSI
jgi:hypothetical protein